MNPQAELEQIRRLAGAAGRPVRLMEVCGTHTVAAFRSGLRSLLPKTICLLSGPGCPVCVTPIGYVDQAVCLVRQPGVTVASFGDMLRVPGTEASLEQARATGASVKIVYSPLDALKWAETHPDQQVIFLGIGFETTAPSVAWTLRHAMEKGISNFSVLCGHKTMPHAMATLLRSGDIRIDGFLCPGHVSVIIGSEAYTFMPGQFHIPCVIAGFEPGDMLQAIRLLLQQTVEGRAEVENQYQRSVNRTGNPAAQALMQEVFEPAASVWRGLGEIPGSGLKIRPAFAACDAAKRFSGLSLPSAIEPQGCRCGDILRGVCLPLDCPLFGQACTPHRPIGACMVSSEGTCAAYYRYGGVHA